MADDIFVRDSNNQLAVNTVVSTEANVPYNYDDCFTLDTNNRRALRVVSAGGGSGGDQHNLGWYATSSDLETAHPTAEAGDWAIVGATDTVWVWDTDNSAWVDSDQKGQVTSVNNQTGAVTISADDILPTQTGNSGKFLTTNGTTASWADITSTPATMPTLAVADWSNNTQTVNVTGVTATNTVFVSPAPASAADYASAGIVCTAQGNGTLSFSCTTVPSNAITVNVVCL